MFDISQIASLWSTTTSTSTSNKDANANTMPSTFTLKSMSSMHFLCKHQLSTLSYDQSNYCRKGKCDNVDTNTTTMKEIIHTMLSSMLCKHANERTAMLHDAMQSFHALLMLSNNMKMLQNFSQLMCKHVISNNDHEQHDHNNDDNQNYYANVH